MIADAASMPKIHKVKHLPTGLYYKPGVNNLSEKGKIYNNNQDCLSGHFGYITISMEKTAKLLKKHPEWFEDWKESWNHKSIYKNVDLSEFEREILSLT